MYFLCVFGEEMCWEERKKAQIAPQNPIFRFWSNLGCQGLFIALGTLFKAHRTFRVRWVDSTA